MIYNFLHKWKHFIQSHIISTQHGVQQLNKPLLWTSCKEFVLHKMWPFICHLNVNTKLMSLFRHSWEIVCSSGLPVSSLSSFLCTITATTVQRAVDMQSSICSHIWWCCMFHTNIDKFCCWSLVCLCHEIFTVHVFKAELQIIMLVFPTDWLVLLWLGF